MASVQLVGRCGSSLLISCSVPVACLDGGVILACGFANWVSALVGRAARCERGVGFLKAASAAWVCRVARCERGVGRLLIFSIGPRRSEGGQEGTLNIKFSLAS
jgi:hypothetical protein